VVYFSVTPKQIYLCLIPLIPSFRAPCLPSRPPLPCTVPPLSVKHYWSPFQPFLSTRRQTAVLFDLDPKPAVHPRPAIRASRTSGRLTCTYKYSEQQLKFAIHSVGFGGFVWASCGWRDRQLGQPGKLFVLALYKLNCSQVSFIF